MQIVRHPAREDWPSLCERPADVMSPDMEAKVRKILDDVRTNGDDAVRRLTKEIDGVDIETARISTDRLQDALANIDPDLKTAIHTAIRNVRTFHDSLKPVEPTVETQPGVTCWRRRTPINPVGLYVPGGTAPLFSTVIMLAVPAQIAGCRDIVLASPPQPDGSVHPVILATAAMLRLDAVYAVGGAQAIAAMTYGTASIPRVNKIFGPGNSWVTCAKQLVSAGGTPIDMPAGPTELLILADDSSRTKFVAADVLAQAEHGPDSQVVVVTWDSKLESKLPKEIAKQMEKLPRREIAEASVANSRLLVVDDAEEAVAFANEYAAEHLSLQCRSAGNVAKVIENAGSVFVGHQTPEALGDYASGTNHTLPTGGHARAWGGVSVDSFCKYISFQRVSARGIAELGPVVDLLATNEELEGHARSVRLRVKANTPKSD